MARTVSSRCDYRCSSSRVEKPEIAKPPLARRLSVTAEFCGEFLFAHCGVAQAACALYNDQAGDDAVIVDAAGGRVFRTRVDDPLEHAVLINKPGLGIGGDTVADDESGIVDAHEIGSVFGFRR